MAEAIKIRVQLQGEYADIRILMPHPMETGQRKDDSGQMVPAWFIQTFGVSLNGIPIVTSQLNSSVARNPLFAFKARGVRPGDRISVSWTDSRGDRRSDEITVA